MTKIDEINARLKRANLGISVVQKGDRLALRATFPPKKNSVIRQPHQQWLCLGVYANDAGLAYAEAEAYKVGSLLAVKAFNWGLYDESLTFQNAIANFEKDYFERRERNPKSETTWKGDYYQILKRFPSDELVDPQTIIDFVCSIKPDSRMRTRAVMVLSAFCKFVGIDINLSRYRAKSKHSVIRQLPDDCLINDIFFQIKDQAWRWAFGVMACYGIRNHELFYLDLSDFPIIFVSDGKTGSRDIFPIYPEWAEKWHLDQVNIPNCSGKNNADLGNRVTHAFRRLNIPFNPYSLRHRYALRALECGIDTSITARQMGHSVKVHTEIYHQWLNKKSIKKAMDNFLNNPDRPLPPE